MYDPGDHANDVLAPAPRFEATRARLHRRLPQDQQAADALIAACRAIGREPDLQIIHQAVALRSHPDAAKQRAQEFLLEHLTPAQRASFDQHQWFVVEGGKSKREYRIHGRGSLIANIEALNGKGDAEHRLCAHCDTGAIPLGDQLLAQKMMLEFDEDAFLRIANRHRAM